LALALHQIRVFLNLLSDNRRFEPTGPKPAILFAITQKIAGMGASFVAADLRGVFQERGMDRAKICQAQNCKENGTVLKSPKF